MKKYFIPLITLALFANCKSDKENNTTEKETSVNASLRISLVPTFNALPVLIAYNKGFFQSEDVSISMKRSFTECDETMIRQSANIIMSDVVRMKYHQDRGLSIIKLLDTDMAFSLVAGKSSRLNKVDQFADKMVGMTRYSLTDSLMKGTFSGLTATVKPFSIQVNDPAIRLKMMINGEIDAAWLCEPWTTIALAYGSKTVVKGRSVAGRGGVFAASNQLFKDKKGKELLLIFEKAYNQACDSITANGMGTYLYLLKEHVDYPDTLKIKEIPFNHIKIDF